MSITRNYFSAVITFSTACTGPNEHTANVRGSKESVAHATTLIKELMKKVTVSLRANLVEIT